MGTTVDTIEETLLDADDVKEEEGEEAHVQDSVGTMVNTIEETITVAPTVTPLMR